MATLAIHAPRAATAPMQGYTIAVPDGARRRLARAWFILALASLVGAGLFSVLLVLARAPYVKDLFRQAEFFRVALIVHVDLSVLVWFTAFAGILWTLAGGTRLMWLAHAGFAAVALGVAAMCAAPFVGLPVPVMSNYIPVLDSRVFLGGLLAFGAGAALVLLRSMLASAPVGRGLGGPGAVRFGLNTALVSAAVALIAFGWSWAEVPRHLDGKAYYEVLFWGGGHVLQFTWTLLMFVAWIVLAEAAGLRLAITPRIATLLFAIGLASVFATPILYLAYDAVSIEHYRLQTQLMRIGGGLAIVPFTLALLAALLGARHGAPATPEQAPLRSALGWSLALFAVGGAIGVGISGSNVKITAHYHGAIVGVTLAFMGLAYHLLPRLGYAKPNARAAAWQPAIYGAGQLAHVLGLVWSGGYGVQRKVAGADSVLTGLAERAGMGLMGVGGLLAVIGGAMFVVIAIDAMRPARRAAPEILDAHQ